MPWISVVAGDARGATVAARSEVDVFVHQSQLAWEWLEETVYDITPEAANWWPPGTANSIGATYLHVVINTDVELCRLLFGREPLIEELWDGDVGQGMPYDPEHFDRWHRDVAVDWERLHDYGRSVHAGLVDWLGGLTDDLLVRQVDMTRADLGMWEGRDLLALHGFNHVRIHGGEIAVLKGLQGGIGWRQSERFANPAPFRLDSG
jgi:DinB superfamily